MNANESIAEEEWEPGAPRQIIEFSENKTDRRNTGGNKTLLERTRPACH